MLVLFDKSMEINMRRSETQGVVSTLRFVPGTEATSSTAVSHDLTFAGGGGIVSFSGSAEGVYDSTAVAAPQEKMSLGSWP